MVKKERLTTKQKLKAAVIKGSLLRVRWLCLTKSVSQNALDAALIEAIKNGRLNIVTFLHKKGANVKFKGPTGTTLVMFAAVFGFLEIVKYLHKNGGDIHAVNDRGKTALITAAAANRLDVVKYLHQNGANIHLRDNEGNDALLWAAKREFPELFKYLMAHNADPNVYNKEHMTAGLYCSGWKMWKDLK
ncbi:MAG: ankyrin repeat domain-containing protein [Bacteroidales bacterium]|jgi:ankyrin repeat protein|nr:ankyrin repeat domain-containing protein [Bacteroidales bacterium]